MADIFELMEDGVIKRYFRARDKFCYEGAISHITQHASGTEPLFLEDSDYLYMLYLVKEVLGEFKCKVLSFVLMPNHIHLLLKFLESNMPDSMKELLQRYAVYFNKKYQRKGHVFCSAYRSALCFDDSYALASSLYIHRNPVEAKIVKKPIDYRWSSCALFLNDIEKETFIDYKFILGILDEDISKARTKYRNLLEKLEHVQIDNAFEQPKALEAMVRMLKESEKIPFVGNLLLCDSDLDKKIQELKDKGKLRGPQERDARKFLIEQLTTRGFNVSHIAKRLNLSRKSVYTYLNVPQR